MWDSVFTKTMQQKASLHWEGLYYLEEAFPFIQVAVIVCLAAPHIITNYVGLWDFSLTDIYFVYIPLI